MRLRIALVAAFLIGCANAPKTRATLEAAGYTDIKVTGWDMFECSEDDAWSTGFVATNSRGKRVEGTVCCGFLFKGCTVRF